MTPQEIERKIADMIRVTPQQVVLAKVFLSKNYHSDPVASVDRLLEHMRVNMPDAISTHVSADTEGMIKQAVEAISWKLAGAEAIWGLISSNLLIPDTRQWSSPDLNVSYTTLEKARTGNIWPLSLNHLTLPVPSRVRQPYSARQDQTLSDPDLFLYELNITNLHTEVEEALREAVRCFLHELYLACLTMLGRASEGAWIELGLKLADAVERTSSKEAEKIRDKQKDSYIGIGKKIMEVLRIYERSDLDDVRKKSGVTLQDLRNSVIWADAVRDSRNSVHYGATPALPNSYEKVAVLLISAVPHIRLLYDVHDAVLRLGGDTG